MRFNSVALLVSDASKSVKWYKEKLGFVVKNRGGHWITVSTKGLDIEFHLCEGHHPMEPGNTGFCFMTKDVAGKQKDLEGKGVKFTQSAKKEDWGIYAMFADPDGNEFWMIQESGWRAS